MLQAVLSAAFIWEVNAKPSHNTTTVSRDKRNSDILCGEPTYDDLLWLAKGNGGQMYFHRSNPGSRLCTHDRHRDIYEPPANDRCAVLDLGDLLKSKPKSLCPWHYKIDTSESRYPREISYAVCECDDCLGPHGVHGFGCEIGWRCRRVLRCVDGSYVQENEPVPMACACLSRRRTG